MKYQVEDIMALSSVMKPRALDLLRAAVQGRSSLNELSQRTGRRLGEIRTAAEELKRIGVLNETDGFYSTDMQRLVELMPYSGG